jgi:glutathione synthase/RimK-type ligase-like ATP-grasp enzyme
MSRVLLVTEAADLAADLLVLTIQRENGAVVRFNVEDFPRDVGMTWTGNPATSALHLAGTEHCLASFDSAWFRRFPRHPPAPPDSVEDFALREARAFLFGVWESLDCHWVNRPSSVLRAEAKFLQLHVASDAGFEIPVTCATSVAADAHRFVEGRACVAKTVAGGRVRDGDAVLDLYTAAVDRAQLTDDRLITLAPVVFQERVARHAEIRVTIVGEKVFATQITVTDASDENVDWRAAPPAQLQYTPHSLPAAVSKACSRVVDALGLAYGAIDLLLTSDGRYVFLEVNPSGQWGWIERETGQPISRELARLLLMGAWNEPAQ